MENRISFNKLMAVALLIILALISYIFLGDMMTDTATYEKLINSLDERADSVLALSATSAIVSAGISAMPGDLATPIAEKLADFSEYFLLVLSVLYAEKYLLTIIGAAVFKYIIPGMLLLFACGILSGSSFASTVAFKLLGLSVILALFIPVSVMVSDTVYERFNISLDETISSAEELNYAAYEYNATENENKMLANIIDRVTETASDIANDAAKTLNDMMENLAVLIVTSCVIPIFVLLFFIWILKLLTGIDLFIFGEGLRKRHVKPSVK